MSRRQYDASARREAAARTQAHVIDVAKRLFLDRGYAATGIADVAGEAGVSPATVYAAFGSKPRLLRRVAESAVVGDAAPVPLAQRPEVEVVVRSRSARERCALTATMITAIQARMAPLAKVLTDAAAVDGEVAEFGRNAERQRREGMKEFTGLLSAAGQLREDLTVERAADIAWVLTSPASYLSLREIDWSDEEYETWLGATLFDSLCRRSRR